MERFKKPSGIHVMNKKIPLMIFVLFTPSFSVSAEQIIIPEEYGNWYKENKFTESDASLPADSKAIDMAIKKWKVPRNDNAWHVSDEQLEKFDSLVQGKSLRDIAIIKSLTGDPVVEHRKQYLIDYANKQAGTFKSLNPQDLRSYLVNENLGLYPHERIFTIPATEKLKNNRDSYIDYGPPRLESKLPYYGKLPKGSNEQTTGEGNGPEIYTPNSTFENDYSVTTISLPSGSYSSMKSESEGCLGNLRATAGPKDPERAEVYKCFRFLNDELYDAVVSRKDFGYLSALPLLASIVGDDSKHICMASFYKEGVWITAKHCVTTLRLSKGINLVVGNELIKIMKEKVSWCSGSFCDVGFISAKTPVVDLNNLELQNPNLAAVNWGAEIFIPGIEEGESIDRKAPMNSFRAQLMWSDVGRGYCKAFKVKKGCINHTCSTLNGFSGAPVYWIDKKDRKIQLIGIHTGHSRFFGCAGSETNYAVTSDQYRGED
ncbi:hypothetical protein PS639_00607 [Pseudomonas fluorescens]|nr:hypothetical protein PS639_00607 [Pseudomonas fluorescens]